MNAETDRTEVLLDCRAIAKSYSGPQVLTDVDFEMRRGEIHALVGENGAGKSTLIKIITGVTDRDAGEIVFDGKTVPREHSKQAAQELGIAVIYQELSLIPGMTVAQNIFLTKEPMLGRTRLINVRRMNEQAQDLIGRYGFELRPTDIIDRLSIAQRQTVEILKALSARASLIIMDEPTSSLTSAEANRLFEIIRSLKAKGISVLYISHRMEEVFDLSDRVTVLRDGRKVAVLDKGKIDPAEIIRLMIGRSLSENDTRHRLRRADGEVVLEVDGLSSLGRFQGITFSLHRGEILGFGGLVGSGRTELVRAIFGIDPHDEGTVRYLGRPYRPSVRAAIASGIGLVPEERRLQGIMSAIAITRNLGITNLDALTRMGMVSGKRELVLARRGIEMMNIKPDLPEIPVGTLSGGNQQKVVLGKWLIRDLKLLIIDEPTVGIDIGAKEEIYANIERLAARGVAVILVSSDLQELTRLSHRIIVLRKGRVIKEFDEGIVTEEDVLLASSGILEGGRR
ncbi:MAG TPA: sugar ABC transporter ATP-binding protein [Rectinemataceae bacterium]|nr:sugar ABC transporter ATP-binding protein [Rectinemataceae bacterium]